MPKRMISRDVGIDRFITPEKMNAHLGVLPSTYSMHALAPSSHSMLLCDCRPMSTFVLHLRLEASLTDIPTATKETTTRPKLGMVCNFCNCKPSCFSEAPKE